MRAAGRGAAVVAALIVCLTACEPGEDGPASPTATPSATGPASRGHALLEPGTPVRHEELGAGAELHLTIRSVEALDTCPGRGAEAEPRLGTFVVLDVTASLAGEEGISGAHSGGPQGSPDDDFVALTPDVFRIAAPDGRVQEIVVTDEAWACFEDADLLPPFVDPGETVSGKVVLESATEHGWVIYAPEGTTGWEWAF